MPNGLFSPSAKVERWPSRKRRIAPARLSATKTSPSGATRMTRGTSRRSANSDTVNPGGTASAAPAGCRTTRGVSRAVAVANGAGRSASVILRRTPGASVRQSPNAAAPVRTRGPSAAQAEARMAKTAAVTTARARAFALLRGLLDRHGERFGPGPRVLGDIEQDALRPVE